MNKLTKSFYQQNTVTVARNLLGQELVHCTHRVKKIGKIVEVEAYLGPHDLASHSSKGLTKRTQIMFGPAGHAYVYLIYGMYFCFNIVTEDVGVGAAVLVRAIEPVINIHQRTQGPGLLCQALGITLEQNGMDLLSNELYLQESQDTSNFEIVESPRIGVDYAKEWANKPLRFYIKGNNFVSRKKTRPKPG